MWQSLVSSYRMSRFRGPLSPSWIGCWETGSKRRSRTIGNRTKKKSRNSSWTWNKMLRKPKSCGRSIEDIESSKCVLENWMRIVMVLFLNCFKFEKLRLLISYNYLMIFAPGYLTKFDLVQSFYTGMYSKLTTYEILSVNNALCNAEIIKWRKLK